MGLPSAKMEKSMAGADWEGRVSAVLPVESAGAGDCGVQDVWTRCVNPGAWLCTRTVLAERGSQVLNLRVLWHLRRREEEKTRRGHWEEMMKEAGQEKTQASVKPCREAAKESVCEEPPYSSLNTRGLFIPEDFCTLLGCSFHPSPSSFSFPNYRPVPKCHLLGEACPWTACVWWKQLPGIRLVDSIWWENGEDITLDRSRSWGENVLKPCPQDVVWFMDQQGRLHLAY